VNNKHNTAKNHWILSMHSNATSQNISWLDFIDGPSCILFCSSSVQFNLFNCSHSQRKGQWKAILKRWVEPCLKLIATGGRGAKVNRQWVPENWSCDEKALPYEPSCSTLWNEQIAALGWAETRTAWIVSDCAGIATEVDRLGASDAVKKSV